MMAKIAKINKEVMKKPFQANYDVDQLNETMTFTVDPVLTLQKRKDFVETVWNLYWSPSAEGDMDYRPYLLEPAIKIMTIIVYTDIELDMVADFEGCYKFAQYSGVYQDVLKAITKNGYLQDYQELLAAVGKYIELKTGDIRAIMQGSAAKQDKNVNDGLYDLINVISGTLSTLKDSITSGSGKKTIDGLIAKIVTGFDSVQEANNADKILDAVIKNLPEKVEDGEKPNVNKRGKKNTGSVVSKSEVSGENAG